MRGASALQQTLERNPAIRLRVFVVWEPVILTDVAPPTSGTLALISDPRARQYWDEDRALSKEIIRAILANPGRYSFSADIAEDTVVWDTVALFQQGATWENELPVPAYYGAPVVDSVEGLRDALSKLGEPAP